MISQKLVFPENDKINTRGRHWKNIHPAICTAVTGILWVGMIQIWVVWEFDGNRYR